MTLAFLAVFALCCLGAAELLPVLSEPSGLDGFVIMASVGVPRAWKSRGAALVRRAERVLRLSLYPLRGYHHYDVPKAVWDDQYRSGGWEYLRDLSETHRNSIIAGCCQRLVSHPAVLDIGCGEGILQELIAPWTSRYTGVDLSSAAIERAQVRADERTTFICADAANFHTDDEYDIIVFNECLYYFPDPVAVVQRYLPHVQSRSGYIVVSVYVSGTGMRIWRMLEKTLPEVESIRLSHHTGKEFIVKVFAAAPVRTSALPTGSRDVAAS